MKITKVLAGITALLLISIVTIGCNDSGTTVAPNADKTGDKYVKDKMSDPTIPADIKEKMKQSAPK